MASITRRRFLASSLAGGATLLATHAAADGEVDPSALSLAEAAEGIRATRMRPVELTHACLRRIERSDGCLKAFITVTDQNALATAREREAELKGGKWRGPLHGIPVALKDNIATKGVRTTAGSAALADRVPDEDAEVVRRLKEAGAVVVGKLNMSELSVGYDSVTSHAGAVVNPWKEGFVAGGSSGGAAAAVAAGMCFAALGTDTAGSVRHPAACCGVVGLKPTYGLVSSRGVVPLMWSLDHVGPIARTVRDTALVLQAVAGADEHDPASLDAPRVDYLAGLGAKTAGLRLGKPAGRFFADLDAEVAAAVDEALTILGQLTAGVREVEGPALPKGSKIGLMSSAEAYAGPGRLVGTEALKKCHPRTQDALTRGAKVATADYIEGRRELELLRRATGSIFAAVDVFVTPTTPNLPILIADAVADAKRPRAERRFRSAGRNLSVFNALGLPAVSVPCGFSKCGLPIGLQLVAPRLGEARLLALAAAYERATAWHKRRPKLG